MSAGVVHIAGIAVQVGAQLRQRCSWCGALMLDYDLERLAVPVAQEGPVATWAVGDLVATSGGASWTVPHDDGDRLPAESCARLDPAVTT